MPESRIPADTYIEATISSSGRGRSIRTPTLEAALGARIRVARLTAGLTQTDLGQSIGVTFQQVQKYELGKDRVAASTLQGIAAALNVHPGSFFDDNVSAPAVSVPNIKEAMDIVEAIQRICSPFALRQLLALLEKLAEVEDRSMAEPELNIDDGGGKC